MRVWFCCCGFLEREADRKWQDVNNTYDSCVLCCENTSSSQFHSDPPADTGGVLVVCCVTHTCVSLAHKEIQSLKCGRFTLTRTLGFLLSLPHPPPPFLSFLYPPSPVSCPSPRFWASGQCQFTFWCAQLHLTSTVSVSQIIAIATAVMSDPQKTQGGKNLQQIDDVDTNVRARWTTTTGCVRACVCEGESLINSLIVRVCVCVCSSFTSIFFETHF